MKFNDVHLRRLRGKVGRLAMTSWLNVKQFRKINCVSHVRFTPIADMGGATPRVRFVPIADIKQVSLFDP